MWWSRQRQAPGARRTAGFFRATALGGVALGGMGFVWLQWTPLPKELDRRRLSGLTNVFLDCHGKFIAETGGVEARSHRPVPLEDMGPWMPALTIAKEDQRFYRHWGVDLRSIAGALLRRQGGASTITQQVVKLATRRAKATYGTKVYESLVAVQLEWRWGKRRILEEYLNRTPYGNRLTGVEAAAAAYFGKPSKNLTKDEALFLVGLPQAPTRLNPWRHREAANAQFARTIHLMRQRGVLEPGETPVQPTIERHLPPNHAPHFIEALENRKRQTTCSLPIGGRMRSTLDLVLQRRVQWYCGQHLQRLHRPDIGHAAFVVIENKSGAVRAIGSVGTTRSDSSNGALLFRDCGSTLKPFLYLTGIQQRILTAATVLPDTADAVREVYPDYDPHNFVRAHAGPVRVREALGCSLNVPAVVALGLIGARDVFRACAAWGVRFERPLAESGAGFILGNAGVTLLDLTGAYSGLARQGVRIAPRFMEEETSIFQRVADPASVDIITDILCDNEARAPAFGLGSPLATGRRIAVKTGTSAGYRDAWTVGFTREHTLGIWVGNFNGRPMTRTASIVAAAPLWRAIVDDVFEHDTPLPVPELKRTRICGLSGLLSCPNSPRSIGEIFLPGTEPADSANTWFGADGKPALPPEYAAWCASTDNTIGARVSTSSDTLRILVPRREAVFVLDPELPARQQQVEFQASEKKNIRWSLNQQPLEQGPDGRMLWQLREGEWDLEISNGVSRDTRKFRVVRAE